MKSKLIVSILVATIVSCSSPKKIVLLQDGQGLEKSISSFEPKLQSDDLLMITVNADSPEAAAPFNLNTIMLQGTDEMNGMGQQRMQSYLIDAKGNIEFPVLGTINLAGKTRTEAILVLKNLLSPYIKKPIVNFRILNFKISVQGEVNRPGTFTINSERITLLDAISLAGDLSIYGKRQNILVIREENGKLTTNYIDITNSGFINSPFYFLKQNDVVYVEPNKTKINSSVIGPNISVAISAVSLLITLVTLLVK